MKCCLFFFPASKQLQEVSLRLVKESFGDAMYNKALSCIKRFREEAIRVSGCGVVAFFSIQDTTCVS